MVPGTTSADGRELSGGRRGDGAQSLRVLAVARRRYRRRGAGDEVECELELLGLVGMLDPPRPEVRRRCGAAARRNPCIMVTGDNGPTAEAIAARSAASRSRDVITGADLAALDDAELARLSERDVVFARIDPGAEAPAGSAATGPARSSR